MRALPMPPLRAFIVFPGVTSDKARGEAFGACGSLRWYFKRLILCLFSEICSCWVFRSGWPGQDGWSGR